MFVVVAGVFNTSWTGRVTAQRRGAGFRLGTFWIGRWSRTSVGDKVNPPPKSPGGVPWGRGYCHDLGGGCLAFVVLEHLAFCFDSSPCAPLSSRSCSAHLVILFANSPFPPALYSILIISSFQNALVSAFFFCQSVSICSAAPIIFLLLY